MNKVTYHKTRLSFVLHKNIYSKIFIGLTTCNDGKYYMPSSGNTVELLEFKIPYNY